MDTSFIRSTSSLGWLVGGALWTLAGLLDQGSHEVLWIPADILLLLGLLALAGRRLHGRKTLGSAGIVVACLGRLTFVVAEILSVVQDRDQNALLPAAALLSALGMTLYGAAVLSQQAWPGPGRFVPLLVGVYPLAVMFPIVAARGGDPSDTAIALWGLTMVVLGAVQLRPTSIAAAVGATS